jgi:hypothetical protein
MMPDTQVKIIDANVILRYLLDCFICVRSKKLKLGIFSFDKKLNQKCNK